MSYLTLRSSGQPTGTFQTLNYSTLLGSSLTASTITTKGMTLQSTLNLSSLVGSTITVASTLTGSTIVATGAVGIGTTAPLGKLHIYDTNPLPSVTGTITYQTVGLNIVNTNVSDGSTGLGGVQLSMAGSAGWASPGTFGIYTTTPTKAGSFPFVIGPSGNVGIGTMAPTTRLQVTSGSLRATNYNFHNWNSAALGVGTLTSAATYWKIASIGSISATNSYGVLSIKGSLGGWVNPSSPPMSVDIGLSTRGALTITGTVSSSSYANAVAIMDVGYVATAGGYDVYLYVKSATFLSFDLLVGGNLYDANNILLYDPATTASTTTSPGTITSLTASCQQIISGGNVGIGTTVPTSLLHVYNGSIVATNTSTYQTVGLQIENKSVTNATYQLSVRGSAGWGSYAGGAFGIYSVLQDKHAFVISGTSYYLPFFTTDGSLNVYSNGLLTQAVSDRRLKEDIIYQTDTASGLSIVNQLKPATFTFSSNKSVTHIGFIAQDVEELIPNATDGKKFEYEWESDEMNKPKFDENGQIIYKLNENGEKIIRPRTLHDRAIIATQTLAIQELSKQNQAQQSAITSLQSELSTVLARLAAAGIA